MQDSGFQVLLQGNNFLRILQGLGVTIGISIVSVLLSLLLGTLFGIVMTSKSKIVRFLSRIYLEFIREIGANTVRLAHYQHDQYFYDLTNKFHIFSVVFFC